MAESSNNNRYNLSLSLLTDGEPVRSLCTLPSPKEDDEYNIVTGSQGGILSSFTIPTCITSIQPGGDGTRHPHNITALLSVPPSSDKNSVIGEGGYISGCKDGVIRVFNSQHVLMGTLKGHENAVTSLSWLPLPPDSSSQEEMALISGSWDGTARVWSLPKMECRTVLTGHENTVSVVGLPFLENGLGRVATGSAGIAQGNNIRDHKVRIWQIAGFGTDLWSSKLVQTVANDHSGPIRGLAYDSSTNQLLSCSNDGTVKVRDLNGICLTTLAYPPTSDGSPPMLLAVTALENGKVVAAAEDGHAVIWDLIGGGEPQVIAHPNCVWTILPLPSPNGDFATACHDGNTRIFTLDPTRIAPHSEIAQFEKAVSESKAKSSSGPTPEEIAKLPKWEMNALQQGRSEGQVQVFNKNNKAIAAQWSDVSKTWIEVGEVTGQNENAGTIDGVSYDHVFPIEVDVASGGVVKLQIGYNNGENPFVVAQKFIDEHMLDQNYLAEIADYIQKRVGDAGGPTLGGAGAGNTMEVHSGPVPMDISTPPASSQPMYQHLPHKGYRSFENGTDTKVFNKMINKICEFYDEEAASSSTKMTKNDLTSTLENLRETLCATNRYHATRISDSELRTILQLIQNWNVQHVFPILDVSRLIVLHPDASQSNRSDIWNDVVKYAIEKCDELKKANVEGTPAAVAVPMMSMRLFANCFRGGSGSLAAVSSNLEGILSCVESFATSGNKNVRLSVATVILNVSSYLMSSTGSAGADSSILDHILSIVGTIIGSGLYESEATVRVLVGLGTLLLANESAKVKANSLHMSSMVEHAGNQHGDKAKAVVGEIRSILG